MTQHRDALSYGPSTRSGRSDWMPGREPSHVDHSGPVVLPGYRDFVLIARSDASEVYRAHQAGVARPVAVKVLLLDDDEAIARFERELDITVSLGRQHPHIVTVIDTGTTNTGRPCIVMEFYDLGSLHDRLRARGPLPWSEVLEAGTVVADALSFAHRHGVLHRDVKPQNILLLPTSYVVADFGIARPIDAGHTSSVEWFSVRHASPQVIDGLAPTMADDIWSLGSTLFTLLDGRAPFAADNGEDDAALAYMRRVRTGQPRSLRRPDVPPGLASVIDRCLARERSDRFPTAAAVHEALRALAAETRAWAPPVPAISTEAAVASARPAIFAEQPQSVAVPAVWQTAAAPPQTAAPPVTWAPPQVHPAVADDSTGATVAGVRSPSEMANLVASIVEAGGYAPGDVTGEQTTAGGYGSRTVNPQRRRRIGRLVMICLAALLAGGVIGIGILAVSRLSDRGSAGQSAGIRLTDDANE